MVNPKGKSMEKLRVFNLGSVDQVSIGHGHCFIVEGEEIALFRPRHGKLVAVENRCPHRQGPLSDGIIGEGKVVCPLHGHKFDFGTGEGSESPECVKVFKVWEEDGRIVIEK